MYWPQELVTTTPYTVLDVSRVHWCDATGSNLVLNLPSVVGKAALYFIFKKVDTSTNTVTIVPPGGKTIDGLASYVLTSGNQIVGVTSDVNGNYFIVDGNMSGSAVGQGREVRELTSGNFSLTGLWAAVTGMSITLNLDIAGTVVINASGTFDRGGLTSIAQAAIGVEVDGVQYYLGETNINNGSGGDNNFRWAVAGTYGIFLTAGAHTIKLIAYGPSGTVLLGASSTPASLAAFFPTVVNFGGGSPTSDPTRDLSGTWNDTLVVGLQGEPLPQKIANAYLKRNAANSGWLLDPTIMSFQKAGVLKSFGRQTINFEDVTNFSTEVEDDITNARVNVRFSGQAGGAGGGISMADSMLLKPFFSDRSFMPSTTFREDLYLYPAPDFSNLNGGTLSRSASRARLSGHGASNPANWGWDLTAAKSKILFVLGGMRVSAAGSGMGIFLAPTLPSTGEIPNNSYLAWAHDSGAVVLYKATAFTSIGSETSIMAPVAEDAATFGLAFYYDDDTDRLVIFYRIGSECWFPIIDVTDSSFTTFRYVGIRIYSNAVMWGMTPMGIYHS